MSRPTRRLLARWVTGSALGVLAALPVVLAEYTLVGGHFGAATPTLRDLLLLLLLTLALILWPALLVGGLAGLLYPRLDAALRSRPWRRALTAALGLTLLALAVVVWVVPELLEMRMARTGLLAAGWCGLWLGLRRWTEPTPERPVLPMRVAWPLVLRLGGQITVLLVWSTVFVAFRIDAAPTSRAAALQYGPVSGVLLEQAQRVVDADGDGYAALFGGGDCDDGSSRRHPSADEIAGNAVDEDCDGLDLPLSVVWDAGHERVEGAIGLATQAADRASVEPPSDLAQLAVMPQALARRSVVLITVDTLRADHVGVLGRSPSPTPHIDALAATGVVFSHARAQGPMTKASVASLMTGLYFSEVHRSTHAWVKVLPQNVLLAEKAQQAGYQTVGVASHWYLSDQNGWEQGFDRLHNVARDHMDRLWHADHATNLAITELEALTQGERPFFLWLHLLDPHHPYVPHASLSRDDPEGLPGFTPGEGKQERYDAEIVWTDRQVGRVTRWLRQHGLLDEVVLVVHSDHGEGFGEHGYEYHGQALFEDQLRVPLVIHAPGLTPARVEAPVSLLDLHVTLEAVLGEVPLAEQARTGQLGRPVSLWPAMLGEPMPVRPIFAEMVPDDNHSHQVTVVDGRYKLIHSFTHNTWQLFDLEADPLEQRNLIELEPRAAQRTRRLLRRFVRERLRPVEPQ